MLFLAQPFADTLDFPACLVLQDSLEHNDELVAAQTEGVVLRPERFPDDTGNLLEQPVPLDVAVRVVDLLELVDVIHAHRQRQAGLTGLLQGPGQLLLARPAVHHLGQIIQPRLQA